MSSELTRVIPTQLLGVDEPPNLDAKKEPVKLINLFFLAYGSVRPDESLKDGRVTARTFLRENPSLEFEGFGRVEPALFLEAIALWSSHYKEDAKFKPSMQTFFTKQLYLNALHNLRELKIEELKKQRKAEERRKLREIKEQEELEREQAKPINPRNITELRLAGLDPKDFYKYGSNSPN